MKRGWGVGILLLCASNAHAQTGSGGFSINASVDGTYDSNVRKGRTNRPGDGQDDFIVEPTVGAGYSRNVGIGSLGVSGSVGYRFYQSHTYMNSETLRFGANAATELGPCSVSGSGSFSRRQSDLQDIAVLDTNNIQNSTTFGGGVNCGSTVGLRPGFQYSHSIITNNRSTFSRGNSTSDTYTVSLGYQRPALGVISLYGSYRDGRYPSRGGATDPLGLARSMAVYSTGLTFQREIGSMLKGTVSVGYMKVVPHGGSRNKFSGINYSGAINYSNGNGLSGTLSFSRAAHQPSLRVSSYSIDTSFSGSLRYQLSQSVGLNASASHEKRNYQDSGLIEDPLAARTDRTNQYAVGATLTTQRRLKFSLSAQHTDRSSEVARFDYKSNRVSLTASMSF